MFKSTIFVNGREYAVDQDAPSFSPSRWEKSHFGTIFPNDRPAPPPVGKPSLHSHNVFPTATFDAFRNGAKKLLPYARKSRSLWALLKKITTVNHHLDQLIEDVVILTLDGEFTFESLRFAIDNMKVEEIEFTGIGCFITFLDTSNTVELQFSKDIHKQKHFRFDGVELENVYLNLLCDINVYIINLKIDHIEIFNKLGAEMNEIPSKYILKQTWKTSQHKKFK